MKSAHPNMQDNRWRFNIGFTRTKTVSTSQYLKHDC